MTVQDIVAPAVQVKAGKIFGLIPKVMKSIGHVGKDQKNTFQNYNFRGIDDIYNAIHPALVEHGVFCCPQVIKSENFEFKNEKGKISYRVLLTVQHRFYADDGSFIDVITIGEGIDTSDKASNKAMSAAYKYAIIELFAIPTQDVADSDRETPDSGTSFSNRIVPQARSGDFNQTSSHIRSPLNDEKEKLVNTIVQKKISKDIITAFMKKNFGKDGIAKLDLHEMRTLHEAIRMDQCVGD